MMTLALALALAQVCANEAGFDSMTDCALVHQATLAHGDTHAERLAWLRLHSRAVLGPDDGTARSRAGNAAWTRNLRWSDAAPAGWPSHWPSWSRFAARWRALRAYALALVAGRVAGAEARPCDGPVWTWGSPQDRARALRMGLVPLRCVGVDGEPTRNEGWALP